MTTPIRFGVAAGLASSAPRSGGPSGTDFASRMSPLGALASGVQSLGRSVLQAATAGLPPVLQNLAQNAAGAVGGAVTGQDAASLDLIDKTRFYVMMNAIFATANMPTVEKH